MVQVGAQAAQRAQRPTGDQSHHADGAHVKDAWGAVDVSQEPAPPDFLPGQARLARVYDSKASQVVVAVVIFVNFFISMIENQILPDDNNLEVAQLFFLLSEWTFNIIFTVELALNMYANFLCSFWRNGWNVFDVLIVTISWLGAIGGNLPGINVLRLLRAFRVFRLFKRVPSLRIIIIGILRSLPGNVTAFVILGLVMAMWSVMGVQFFGDDFPDEYGNFFKGCLTCIQMATYDSWVSGVTRPIVMSHDPEMRFLVSLYFVSYIFVSAIIMLQVLVAILIDKYNETVNQQTMEDMPEALPLPRSTREVLLATEQTLQERLESIKNICDSMQPHRNMVSRGNGASWRLPGQARVRSIFEKPCSQMTVVVIIFASFFGSVLESQIKPVQGTTEQAVFEVAEIVFNVLFLIELLVNMYAHFFWSFATNVWNLVDASVVIASWAMMLFSSEDDVTVLRLLRAFRRSVVAFRVIKLFRLGELQKVVIGVLRSLPGVANAFLMLGLVMSIWAIMGVEFYSANYPDYFKQYSVAMLTMMQIMAFDSWSSGITRVILLDPADIGEGDVINSLFFVSYIFAASIIMANVVLAILIDKFLSTTKEIEDQSTIGEWEHPVCRLQRRLGDEMAEIEKLLASPLQKIAEAQVEQLVLLTQDSNASEAAAVQKVPAKTKPGAPAGAPPALTPFSGVMEDVHE